LPTTQTILRKLKRAGLAMKESVVSKKDRSSGWKNRGLYGRTGGTFPRSEAERRVRELGGNATSSVSPKRISS